MLTTGLSHVAGMSGCIHGRLKQGSSAAAYSECFFRCLCEVGFTACVGCVVKQFIYLFLDTQANFFKSTSVYLIVLLKTLTFLNGRSLFCSLRLFDHLCDQKYS